MSKFMNKDFKIVEKFKWLVLISIVVFIVGGVFMGINHGLNIGIDYEGGAKIEIELGNYAENSEVKKAFSTDIKKYIEDAGFKVADEMQVSPLSDGGVSYEFRLEYYMDGQKVNRKDNEAQNAFTFKLMGDVLDDSKNGFVGDLQNHLQEYLNSEEMKAHGAFIESDAKNVRGYIVGATASAQLLKSAIIATIVAIVVILIYIIIRFTFSSGLAAIIALAHDVLFMVAFTAIFNIPVNSTFIAAVITIIGYSINATIVIFDKIRECRKSTAFSCSSDAEIANYAIKHSFVKIMLSTITTLIMVVALVIFSVTTIQEFIYPIIFGLIGGTFSSLCLSPSIWVLFRKIGSKKTAKQKKA